MIDFITNHGLLIVGYLLITVNVLWALWNNKQFRNLVKFQEEVSKIQDELLTILESKDSE